MKKWIAGLILLPAALAAEVPSFQDDFRQGLAAWVVEQQPGGSVTVADGRMLITDAGGCTVWFRERLTAPVTIRYTARVTSGGRVSDLNCFWMADDPARPGDLFGPGHARTGKFATYDSLRTYYVGYGGNTNTTTRFRRYDGSGARPLRPEHDLGGAEFLLQPDHAYEITLVAGADGRVRFIRDGVVVFDWTDPEPLRNGWFGFRTVNSRIEITNFRVHAGVP
jgi:hypothetical protein